MKKILVPLGAMLICQSANATIWNVDKVISGSDGGFGFSSLHQANDNTPMSGNKLVDIGSASGSYDDVSGDLELFLGLSNNDSLTLAGNLLFGANGFLSSNSRLSYSGLANLAGSTFGTANSLDASGSIGFLGMDVCCNGNYDPNSFKPVINGGGLHYLSLWGADYGGGAFSGSYTGSKIGTDMRLEMSAVPVPSAIYLFGSALLGLVGWRRRNFATRRAIQLAYPTPGDAIPNPGLLVSAPESGRAERNASPATISYPS
jgi:hypothetical protein